MTGVKAMALCSMMLVIVDRLAARTQARALPVQFKDFTRAFHPCGELGRVMDVYSSDVPDSLMAARNGGFLGFVITSVSTEAAPADSPKMVTFWGEPPKACIFR